MTSERSVECGNFQSTILFAKLTQGNKEPQHGLAGSAVHSVPPIRLCEKCILSLSKVPLGQNSVQCSLFPDSALQGDGHFPFMNQSIANEIPKYFGGFI